MLNRLHTFAFQTVQNQYPTQKTRMRTSFDPELELPKLQRWFAENQHPSRHQVSLTHDYD
jgi:homeobox domain-containing protein